jgi:hydroxymethylglutaryl-CoA lyase
MVTPLIQIVEVGPRDGLQNEAHIWSVNERANLIDLLSLCGFAEIEVGSFVSPKWVPQMAETAEVFQKIHPHPNVRYSALVPNEKGMDEALMTGVRNISIFTAASEAFNQKNTNCSIEESFVRFEPVMAKAKKHNLRVRGYISCVVVCPFSGPVDASQVANVAERLWQMGCGEISLGDTIGKGTPETIATMVRAVKMRVPIEALAIHCHDTYGSAVGNVLSALAEGVRIVDASIYGLGGCPYGGENAKGNIATEKIVNELHHHHYQTQINLEALARVREFVRLTLNGKNSEAIIP